MSEFQHVSDEAKKALRVQFPNEEEDVWDGLWTAVKTANTALRTRAEIEAMEADARRWFKVWELDLILHRLENKWWCTRVNLYRDTITYPECATREEAIDAAIAQEQSNES